MSVKFCSSPLPDESLQSWVLRLHCILGYYDFRPLISSSGYWQSRSKIPHQVRLAISNLPKPRAYELLSLSIPVDGCFHLSENLGKAYNYLLYGHTHSIPERSYLWGGLRVSFCRQCFEQQQYEFGFSYFKHAWLFTDFCDIHEKHLENIKYIKDRRELTAFIIDLLQNSRASRNLKEEINSKPLNSTTALRSQATTVLSRCALQQYLKYFCGTAVYPFGYLEMINYSNSYTEVTEQIRMFSHKVSLLLDQGKVHTTGQVSGKLSFEAFIKSCTPQQLGSKEESSNVHFLKSKSISCIDCKYGSTAKCLMSDVIVSTNNRMNGSNMCDQYLASAYSQNLELNNESLERKRLYSAVMNTSPL